MNNFNNEEFLRILRNVNKYPKSSQRELANKTGISLGKLNYCLNALIDKGLVKIRNFKRNKNKINYIYELTPKGILIKTKLTINYMKIKMKEYDELRLEIEQQKHNV